MILNYRNFLELCTKSDDALAPGFAIDFVWHTHQCSPQKYQEVMEAIGHFTDHNPCGEDNPADPIWVENTFKAWETFLKSDIDPTLFFAKKFASGHCCSIEVS